MSWIIAVYLDRSDNRPMESGSKYRAGRLGATGTLRRSENCS